LRRTAFRSPCARCRTSSCACSRTSSKHNLGALLDAGLVATVNSDDPAYFGGYMNQNFTQTFAATGLNVQHAWQLAANSFEGSFIDTAAKRAYVDRLNAVFASF
jgi:adenosine deaminase